MKMKIVIAFGTLLLLGAGCSDSGSTYPVLIPEEQPKVNNAPEQKAVNTPKFVTLSEADFINEIMKNTSTWLKYESKETGITFQYPQGLFTDPNSDEQLSGLRYLIQGKPTAPEDGECDGLGDVDCIIEMWPKRYADFFTALKGTGYVYAPYESVTVAQRVRTINKVQYVRLISQGINGSCVLSYVTATDTAYASFDINICDDPQLATEFWQSQTVLATEKLKAENILAGKNLSSSTRTKIEAIEKVLATLKIE